MTRPINNRPKEFDPKVKMAIKHLDAALDNLSKIKPNSISKKIADYFNHDKSSSKDMAKRNDKSMKRIDKGLEDLIKKHAEELKNPDKKINNVKNDNPTQ